MGTFLAFLGLAAVVIVTPGPDTAITIRNTLLGGRMGGVMTALGIAGGQMIWASAASLGIVALLVASEPLFLAVKYAGAAYLVYLGLQALREAVRPSAPLQMAPTQTTPVTTVPAQTATSQTVAGSRPARRLRPLAAFRQGMISNLGNPKMAVFFASLLPQFVPAGAATFSAFLFLGVVFAAMTFVWLALYAAFVARLGDVLRRPSIRRWIEGVTGTVLIALGLRVAAEQR